MGWVKFISLSLMFFLLSHYAAVFPHEFSHSIVAWLLGLKVHPFLINYGGTHVRNILFLSNIDENNNYYLMYLLGKESLIPIVAAAGPLVNVLLYLLSTLVLFKFKRLRTKPSLFYFVFWFNLMNLGNIYDYVPLRVFTTHGDIGYILFGLGHLSPWWIFIPGVYIVILLYYFFFTQTLPLDYKVLFCNQNTGLRCFALLVLSAITLFGFFGASGLVGYSDICTFISLCSMLSVPLIVLANLSRLWQYCSSLN